MGKRYPPEFRDEAVRHVVERGYSVREVSERLGVSRPCLYNWLRITQTSHAERQARELEEARHEIQALKARLRSVEDERDALMSTLSCR